MSRNCNLPGNDHNENLVRRQLSKIAKAASAEDQARRGGKYDPHDEDVFIGSKFTFEFRIGIEAITLIYVILLRKSTPKDKKKMEIWLHNALQLKQTRFVRHEKAKALVIYIPISIKRIVLLLTTIIGSQSTNIQQIILEILRFINKK